MTIHDYLGNACDALILLVLAGVTPRQQVKRTRVMLDDAGRQVNQVYYSHADT
jgi:hypothetical protein